MSPLLAAVCALSLHTLLGGAACAALAATLDRRLAACRDALIAPVAVASLALPLGLGAGWLASGDTAWLLEPVRALIPGAFTATAALAATGCHLVLHAGRLEATGRPAPPRALLRGGGKIMFFGAELVVGLTLISVLDPAGPARAALAHGGIPAVGALVAGGAACAAGGFSGLLAGISAKPRPSGAIGAGLYAAGIVLLCVGTSPG